MDTRRSAELTGGARVLLSGESTLCCWRINRETDLGQIRRVRRVRPVRSVRPVGWHPAFGLNCLSPCSYGRFITRPLTREKIYAYDTIEFLQSAMLRLAL